jgi:hypothetical protein
LFALTWTVMHAIDEKSPLAGYDAERLEEGDARLFLSRTHQRTLIDILAHSVHCGTLTPSILVRIQVPQPGSRPQIAAYL